MHRLLILSLKRKVSKEYENYGPIFGLKRQGWGQSKGSMVNFHINTNTNARENLRCAFLYNTTKATPIWLFVQWAETWEKGIRPVGKNRIKIKISNGKKTWKKVYESTGLPRCICSAPVLMPVLTYFINIIISHHICKWEKNSTRGSGYWDPQSWTYFPRKSKKSHVLLTFLK